jgi:hypothetical protein
MGNGHQTGSMLILHHQSLFMIKDMSPFAAALAGVKRDVNEDMRFLP